jgi:acyl-coenzyme A synthetase/AMP-(fatty) acid ligase
VRLVRASGERVMPSDIARAHRFFPAARVLVSYACTETGPISIHATARDETFQDVVPVGRPLDGIAVRILDEQGRDVRPGDEGEIAVQSAYISPGYWQDPDRTAQVFAKVPERPDELLYHTGDLGRMTPDGRLEHLGRKDFRVKIRGFRVELEEIEAVINQHPDVVRAAVAAKPDVSGDLRLVAYVQLAPDSDVLVETLRGQIGFRLPEHMIPSTFVFVAEIPLTGSGKIARQLLPDPPAERPALGTQYVMPRTPLEATIAGVWREVLGLETVGVHDAFLTIGGDSLKASLVASRLLARLGIDLPLMTLFEASTIRELADALERQTRSDDAPGR